ncbi:MAG TPA: hypothetical protein VK509_01980 [Polyangiales bacterium]|nr:hypothetical protein [Polyangiales bacterium]
MARAWPRIVWSLAAGALCTAAGCELEQAPVESSAYPTAGLYTPGSALGASDPSDLMPPATSLGNRCASLAAAGASTAGVLRIEYRTQSLMGRYAPKNCSAVWIETADGRYVATLELSAALRRPGLVYFQDHACSEKLGPDVVTSATKSDHMKAHSAMWSGADFETKPAPDGAYKLMIEVAESDKEPGELTTFDFEKGPMGFTREAPVAVDGPLQQVTISWELAPGGNAGAPGG